VWGRSLPAKDSSDANTVSCLKHWLTEWLIVLYWNIVTLFGHRTKNLTLTNSRRCKNGLYKMLPELRKMHYPDRLKHYLVGVFAKYGTNCPFTVWKILTNVKKIPFSAMLKKMKKWSEIYTQIQITTKRSLLEGHPLPMPAKSVSAFVSYPVYRMPDGIRIRIFGRIRISVGSVRNCCVDALSFQRQSFSQVWYKLAVDCIRNNNKCPKIPYTAVLKKKWPGIHTRIRITTKS